ncbi:MAG TPA: acyl-ACP--UDP-N-acetylglucosamine O-acyltransferase [Smithellaceae bacterium]|nr:acyl-ACP--UDP-N-acetylglucosamine O-acyltransferase [Smithellaceae bacterium]HRS89424.1 acyl-ACP--UDP-N-acetylglucosamine O-acyltransferase [Smithellaceae bacterium]HRV26167.1 acyl-ACP--UDP-N-acetylglucosamine O-acyltransferase [Smithellaceae bacterium]
MKIHSTAIVDKGAQLEQGVEIGAYSIIGPDVKIGKNTIVGPHVVMEGHTVVGEGCHILQFCSIGAPPQDLKYKGGKTFLIIGDFNSIREFVTIHRATTEGDSTTSIGSNNIIMSYCHIAHNCKLGDHVVMANNATLAGHVRVEDYAVIGGLTGIHQNTNIGAHCIIGGASAVVKDVPPYTMAAGNHAKLFGLNLIGLKRRNFSAETIKGLKKAYHTIFRSQLLLEDALKKAQQEAENIPEVLHFVEFIRLSQRGTCR